MLRTSSDRFVKGVTSQLTQSPSELRKREISNELTIGNVFVLFFGI